MEPSKKISEISKEINCLKEMGINNTVRELLLQELKAKKNAHNRKLNFPCLRRRNLSELLDYTKKWIKDINLITYIYSDIHNNYIMQKLVNIYHFTSYGLFVTFDLRTAPSTWNSSMLEGALFVYIWDSNL